jgi:hypothetical protein
VTLRPPVAADGTDAPLEASATAAPRPTTQVDPEERCADTADTADARLEPRAVILAATDRPTPPSLNGHGPPHASRPQSRALPAATAEELAVLGRVEAATRLLAATPVPEVWTVSVVLVTSSRPPSLANALRSVLRQSYGNWELLVVDASAGPPVLLPVTDGRVRVLSAPGAGAVTAANRGLEAATGLLIAHLADDEEMGHHWLRAVASTLATCPAADVVCGERLALSTVDDLPEDLVVGCRRGLVRLATPRQADLSVVAHRREALGARRDDGPGGDLADPAAALLANPACRRTAVAAALGRVADEPPPVQARALGALRQLQPQR